MNLFANEQRAAASQDRQHSPLPSASHGALSEDRTAERASKLKEAKQQAVQAPAGGGSQTKEKFKDDEYVIRPRVLRTQGRDNSRQRSKVSR